MPVVSFASAKGGVGKSTACLLAGSVLCEGGTVTVIDADQNAPLLWWNEGRKPNDCPNLFIKDGRGGIGALLSLIETEAASADLVLVDLEGVATSENAQAFAMSNLVVLPMQPTELDLRSAVAVIQELGETPFSILHSRAKGVLSRGARRVETDLREAPQIHVFATKVYDREPFNAMFTYRRPLEALPVSEVLNTERAVANARAYAGELLARLKHLAREAA